MGLVKDFLKWLKTSDENEIEDGEINIKAFGAEDKETIEALKKSNKEIDEMGKSFFEENRAKYKNRIKAKENAKLQEVHHIKQIEDTEKDNIKVRSSKSQKVQSERE